MSCYCLEFYDSFSLKWEVLTSAILTGTIYGIQLLVAIQNYKKHKRQLYKGIYEDIPLANNFKLNDMASSSVHYSGFLVGYMAWGFFICFHSVLIILILIRLVSLRHPYVQIFLTISVPIFIVYLLKMTSMKFIGQLLFTQKFHTKLRLKNRMTYAIFVYFSFFAGKCISIG
jgi:hypothetical protein